MLQILIVDTTESGDDQVFCVVVLTVSESSAME